MRTLALVPARAGSKGIPHKNTREFLGRPLVEWAIDVARATCDAVCVTTDDINVMRLAGPRAFIRDRPPRLAQDDSPMLPVIQDALAAFYDPGEPDVVVLLQPTSPSVRRAEHVRAALALLQEKRLAASVASVVEIPIHYNPDRALAIERDGDLWRYDKPEGDSSLDSFPTRRQDSRPGYYFDGTVYAIRRKTIEGGSRFGYPCLPLIVPANESATIDTEEDWALAEAKHG